MHDWIGKYKQEDELKGFKWRSGKCPETNGIWMWSEIFKYESPKGDKMAIIVLDTQGIFDNKCTLKDCI